MRNIFWSMTLIVACLFGVATAQAQKQVTTNNAIVPGEVWNDTDGNPINAHGGGIQGVGPGVHSVPGRGSGRDGRGIIHRRAGKESEALVS